MAEPCFMKTGSNPPVCGVHNIPLVRHQSSEDFGASRYGDFVFLVCPASGQVVDGPAKRK
jgi:hypothetical protein